MEIEERLRTTGLPIAYRMFREYKGNPIPEPPYIIWAVQNKSQRGSDSKNLLETKHILIELYSKKKEPLIEFELERLFSDVPLDIWEDYMNAQNLYVTSYEFDITEKLG